MQGWGLMANLKDVGNQTGLPEPRGRILMGRSNRIVRAGPPVTDLVTRASTGDKQAWDALVERYAPLIWSICGRYRLSRADAKTSARTSGSAWRAGWIRFAIRPRCPGGSPPLPAGSA